MEILSVQHVNKYGKQGLYHQLITAISLLSRLYMYITRNREIQAALTAHISSV